MAVVMAEERDWETGEVKNREMPCTADSVGSVECTPGSRSPDLAERKMKTSGDDECMP
jgi:hypothetical protein